MISTSFVMQHVTQIRMLIDLLHHFRQIHAADHSSARVTTNRLDDVERRKQHADLSNVLTVEDFSTINPYLEDSLNSNQAVIVHTFLSFYVYIARDQELAQLYQARDGEHHIHYKRRLSQKWFRDHKQHLQRRYNLDRPFALLDTAAMGGPLSYDYLMDLLQTPMNALAEAFRSCVIDGCADQNCRCLLLLAICKAQKCVAYKTERLQRISRVGGRDDDKSATALS